MSRGEMVPDVMTTLLKRSNTGPMARAGSRQLVENVGESQIPSAGQLLHGRNSREMEDGVRYGSMLGLVWLEDE